MKPSKGRLTKQQMSTLFPTRRRFGASNSASNTVVNKSAYVFYIVPFVIPHNAMQLVKYTANINMKITYVRDQFCCIIMRNENIVVCRYTLLHMSERISYRVQN